jgi:hypothetical protein
MFVDQRRDYCVTGFRLDYSDFVIFFNSSIGLFFTEKNSGKGLGQKPELEAPGYSLGAVSRFEFGEHGFDVVFHGILTNA